MILVASQRGGAKQLGLHLLKTEENEHVEVHEIRGFVARDVVDTLKKIQALSQGTRCKQYLFSVSLNPPQTEFVPAQAFESALAQIESRNGLTGQPRVVVFHEKEGRRHCHAVWSRIDVESMTAKPLPYFKRRLQDIARELYLEHGWRMPDGLKAPEKSNSTNFELDEWQQAKRAGAHAGDLKQVMQECWAASDDCNAFKRALEEHGLRLARGDRRGHIAITQDGEVLSIARYTGKKAKEVRAKLGDESELQSVAEISAQTNTPRLVEAFESVASRLAYLINEKRAMTDAHQTARALLDAKQKTRHECEAIARAARLRTGLRGLWDRVTGRQSQIVRKNELEAEQTRERDEMERNALIAVQLRERQRLQADIRTMRNRYVKAVRRVRSNVPVASQRNAGLTLEL